LLLFEGVFTLLYYRPNDWLSKAKKMRFLFETAWAFGC